MNYEKPQVLETGMSEGIYTASGACDCFYIEIISENPTAALAAKYWAVTEQTRPMNPSAFGGYWLEFNIHRNTGHTHVVDEDWANMYAQLVFNNDLSGLTVRGGAVNVSGSVITIELASIVPADAGDYSIHGIQIVGEGSANLECISIEAKHH